ncbi:hypothetical protein ACTXT7_012429 [Hymenolepis weldensis]
MNKAVIGILLILCLVTFQAQAWWTKTCCACPGDGEPGSDFMSFTGGISDEDLEKRSGMRGASNRRGHMSIEQYVAGAVISKNAFHFHLKLGKPNCSTCLIGFTSAAPFYYEREIISVKEPSSKTSG